MCHHSDACPELSGGLVQVLDIFCHHRGGNGLPCLLNDQNLAVLLDSHLLDEEVHDDESDEREKERVILDGVNLEDYERLIKETGVQVLIESHIMIAALVELLHQIVVSRQVDAGKAVLVTDFRKPLYAEFIEGIEAEVVNLAVKMCRKILCDGLLNQLVLSLGDSALRTFPDEHDEVLEEANLLNVVLLALNAERIHRDRMLVRIADVFATDIFAKSLI